MAKPVPDDELWQIIEPVIPKKKRRFRYPGRQPLPTGARPRRTAWLPALQSPADSLRAASFFNLAERARRSCDTRLGRLVPDL